MRTLRALRIAWVFLTRVALRCRRASLGRALRSAFQELGVTFVKFGQLLSGRYDVLPESDLRELRTLLDNVNPLPDATMLAIVREELGAKADELRDMRVLASASISQAYAATLRGKSVVVKVLRPGIGDRVETDLVILYRLARVAEFFIRSLKRLEVSKMILEMRDWMRQEIDFTVELRNMEQFRFHLASTFSGGKIRADLGRMVVPLTYPDFSTKRVLVMEKLEGLTVSAWMRGERPDNLEAYEPQKSLLTFFVGSLRPLFHGHGAPFHGDPHPANTMLLPHGDVGLIDFGLMGQYDEATIRSANRLFFAIFFQNASMATDALIRFAKIPRRYREELLPSMEEYLEGSLDGGFAEWMQGVAGILVEHKIPGSLALPLMIKFVLLVDSMAHEFFPGQSTRDLLGSELESGAMTCMMRNVVGARFDSGLLALLYALSEKFAEGPRGWGKIFG